MCDDEIKANITQGVENAVEAIKEQDWYLDNKRKGVLDSVQEKIVSRKLLVFLVATGLFVWTGLDPETWGMIAMCYIGGQSAIDFAKIWKA